MKNQKNNKIKEGFIFGACFVVLLLLTMFIPSLELIVLFILPVPIAMYGYRYGWKASAIVGGIILLSISLLAFYFFVISLPLALIALLAGGFIGEALRSQRHPYETWIRGTIGFALGFLVLILIVELLVDVSLAKEYQLMIRESLDSTQFLLGQAGLDLTSEELVNIERQMMVLLDLIPSILIIASMVYSFVSQWVTHKALNKWDHAQLSFPSFRMLQMPKMILWIYLIVIILSLFNFSGIEMVNVIIINASVILSLIFSIQGLSFLLYFLAKKKQPTFVSVLVVILCLIILPIGMYLTRILGIIDVGFELRKRVI
ncbi:YybS family protein [Amphibacillus sp. MSJ-3]|uniref:YybS family protein n=1 Tax=Amphibacillus sp. MSJ-3 TaxID=2841505 RepID=UPI001C0EC7FA|nr:DUF2232 domain-containing protein [Amphibacillus sp. MSJ-3]MBU5594462.1 YybS family protein [Amphibacillus sp. MSJ-3]